MTNLDLYAQKEHLWEIGLEAYFYHLKAEDLAGPKGNYSANNYDIRIAYYRNPSKLFGLYISFNFGAGGIFRYFPEHEWNQDLSKNQDFIIGTTFNPAHSSKFWINLGGGINRLVINGQDDYTAGGGGGSVGVIYTGSITYKIINNLSSSGTYIVTGWPKFERVVGMLDIGLHQKLIRTIFIYFNYKPILTTNTIRNDFSVGLSWIHW